jgi:hypothetical protein
MLEAALGRTIAVAFWAVNEMLVLSSAIKKARFLAEGLVKPIALSGVPSSLGHAMKSASRLWNQIEHDW